MQIHYKHTVFTQMQDEVFPLNLANIWGCLQFMHEVPNQTVPNRMALNRTMQSQTKACITKSCAIWALVRHYMAWSGNSAPTFRENRPVPASRVKTRQNTAQVNWQNLLFGTLSIT